MKENINKLTGVLFVLNANCFIQLVEAPTKILVNLLRNLAQVSGWNNMNPAANAGGKGVNMNTAATQATAAVGGKALLPGQGGFSQYGYATTTGAPGSSSFIPVDPRGIPLLKRCAILSFTEEVPREYHIWATRSMRPQPEESSELAQKLNKEPLRIMFETLKNMLELGRDLAPMNEEKAIDFIQTSTSKQLSLKLPSTERLAAFLDRVDELCTITEWLEIYDTPIEFTLENEKVWPVEPFLKY